MLVHLEMILAKLRESGCVHIEVEERDRVPSLAELALEAIKK
jgi:hypothetical protein